MTEKLDQLLATEMWECECRAQRRLGAPHGPSLPSYWPNKKDANETSMYSSFMHSSSIDKSVAVRIREATKHPVNSFEKAWKDVRSWMASYCKEFVLTVSLCLTNGNNEVSSWEANQDTHGPKALLNSANASATPRQALPYRVHGQPRKRLCSLAWA